MKTSNKFTLTRVLCAPVFFLVYFIPIWTGYFQNTSVFILIPLLAVAELTDFFDGFFARKNKEVSDFGKLFDPFADVTLHITTFTCFMITKYLHPALFMMVFYREYSMIFLRMVAVKRGVAIAARKGGKLKTVLYVIFGFLCLLIESILRLQLFRNLNAEYFVYILRRIVFVLSCLMAVACYASFIDYLRCFWSVVTDSEKK